MQKTTLTPAFFATGFAPLPHLLLLVASVFLPLAGAHADQATYNFTGNIVANNSPFLNPGDFGSLTNAVAISGSATIQTGLTDLDDGSPAHGSFDGALIMFDITLAGIGTWTSTCTGHYELWNNAPNVYPYDNVLSIVGGGGTRSGPAMGGNSFSDAQLVFGSGGPGMLSSDAPPTSLANWDHAYLYLNYFSGGGSPLPTTVRMEFAPFAVPEPTAFALLGLGAATLLLFRRKNRRG